MSLDHSQGNCKRSSICHGWLEVWNCVSDPSRGCPRITTLKSWRRNRCRWSTSAVLAGTCRCIKRRCGADRALFAEVTTTLSKNTT